uniref:Uncharacterized protein n=1 Tax=Oryza rufipogon TaxID=4529 RepID=A0A0E0QCA0_ORYRU
ITTPLPAAAAAAGGIASPSTGESHLLPTPEPASTPRPRARRRRRSHRGIVIAPLDGQSPPAPSLRGPNLRETEVGGASERRHPSSSPAAARGSDRLLRP